MGGDHWAGVGQLKSDDTFRSYSVFVFFCLWLGDTTYLSQSFFFLQVGLIEPAPDAGKDWGQDDKRETEDEMVRWCHQLNGHEFK